MILRFIVKILTESGANLRPPEIEIVRFHYQKPNTQNLFKRYFYKEIFTKSSEKCTTTIFSKTFSLFPRVQDAMNGVDIFFFNFRDNICN